MNQDIQTKAISEIENRLSVVFGDNLDDVKKIMESFGVIISGSFLIQCILGEKWDGSDIDMYITHDESYYPTSALEKYLDTKYVVCQMSHGYGREVDDLLYSRSVTQCNNKDIHDKNMKLEVINVLCDRKDIINDVLNIFDFDICKNVCYVENGKFNLRIGFLQDILEKKIKFNCTRNIFKSKLRADKYKKRGFKIYINNEEMNDDNYMKYVLDNLDIRKFVGIDNSQRVHVYKINKNIESLNKKCYMYHFSGLAKRFCNNLNNIELMTDAVTKPQCNSVNHWGDASSCRTDECPYFEHYLERRGYCNECDRYDGTECPFKNFQHFHVLKVTGITSICVYELICYN